MPTLLLRLAGPLQSWGDSSRFTRRETRTAPTKSGVLGLLAAAQGRRRTDEIEDLVELRFGVRVDQPGRLVRDFQTAIRWTSAKRESMPLSYRYYLADAVFVTAVEGERGLVEGLDEAVRAPAFPLYLGRRSCPPALPVSMGVVDSPLETALREAEWQAATWYRKTLTRGQVPLEVIADVRAGETEGGAVDARGAREVVRDVPASWDPRRREYLWREVAHLDPVPVENALGRQGLGDEPDFFAAVGGAPCI